MISGNGVDRAGASKALLEIVELLTCPVLTTMAGRSTVPSDHPNYVFRVRSGRRPGPQRNRRHADRRLARGEPDMPFDKYWGDPPGSA